ncbi:hypothetical protein JZM22_26115, partial [Escherichia coli]|nr:hypothetical protein [Escherichia coli]
RIRSPKPVSTERCNLLNLHDHVGRIRRLRRIRQSTAGGHKMASAADTPSTATARKGFAGYDHPNQYPQNAAIY